MEENTPNLKGSDRRVYHYQAEESSFLPFVLYIADDDYHILLVNKILDHIPEIRFQTSVCGDTAFAVALKEKPHLVLIDMDIQAGNGYELLALLQEHPLTRKTPVFALTSSSLPHEQKKAEKAGFKRQFCKPIRVHEFFNAVNQELEEIFQQGSKI